MKENKQDHSESPQTPDITSHTPEGSQQTSEMMPQPPEGTGEPSEEALQDIAVTLQPHTPQERRRKRKKAVFLSWLLVILTAVLLITGTAMGMRLVGKANLMKKANTTGPSFTAKKPAQLTPDTALTQGQQQTDQTTPQEATQPTELEEPQYWEDDWIRYNGEVYDYNDKMMNFLVMGIDKDTPVAPNPDKVSGGQADAIFLVSLNPVAKSITVIGVNRDTMVEVAMIGMGDQGQDIYAPSEIAVQHGFGDGMEQSCELTRDLVSDLFYGLPIHGYISVNRGAITALNDAVGGVDVVILEDMTKWRKGWTEGTQVHLEGSQAYDYVQKRDTKVFASAYNRLERQKQYLKAFIKKALEETRKDITKPITLYNQLKPYTVTDITVDEMTYLATELVGYSFSADQVYTLPGDTVEGEKFEQFYPDYEALQELMISIYYSKVEE